MANILPDAGAALTIQRQIKRRYGSGTASRKLCAYLSVLTAFLHRQDRTLHSRRVQSDPRARFNSR